MILCVCPNPAIDTAIMLDDFKPGKVNRAFKELSFPGGKGVHVALGVKELGEEVVLLAFWGGATGRWIRKECEALGIRCYGPEVAGWSRTCLTIRAKNNFDETELLGKGPIINEQEYAAFLKAYESLLEEAELVSMSGSWPENFIGADYCDLIERASKANVRSFVDCSGKALVRALEQRPYAVHINHFEGYEIYKLTSPEDVFAKMEEQCEMVALTFGSKGLYLYKNGEMVHALSKVENVISAVGSGDSLMSGLLVAQKRKYGLLETAKLAASAGAANCIKEAVGMFNASDVEKLVRKCKAKVIQLNHIKA